MVSKNCVKLEKIIIENIEKMPKSPISLLLSGGIDSSLVLALVKKVRPEIPISTFTLARSKDYPDAVFAREIAEKFGAEHNEVILSDKKYNGFNNEYEKVKRYDFNGDINVYILCSYAKKFSNIIVTGDGGDECFGGYWLHKFPVGHEESGAIKSFEELHPESQKYIREMVDLGFRNVLFKEKSVKEDFDSAWEFFVQDMAPRHLEPLVHTAKILDIEIYTPLFSETLHDYIRTLPSKDRIERKIERDLALRYLPRSVIERKSIGFDSA